MKRSRDDLLFTLGVGLWVAVIALTWPQALSFSDEVGYVGRAKLLVEGHLSWVAHSPGVWVPTARGPVGKYPLFHSLLLATLAVLTPRAMFALGVLAAVVLATTARAILKSWGKSPLWALLVLAHPTVAILARTTMADLPQAAAAVAAWWAVKRGRAFATVAWLALLVALKPTGAVLALGVVAGEGLSSLAALRARDAATWRRLAWGVVGGIVGFFLLIGCNYASNGHLWFDYTHAGPGTEPFALKFFAVAAPPHLATLLLAPPLLVAGAWSYWKRRELGPLLLGGAYVAMMCVYYFVDVGANRLETLALAPRLILPAVAFLLIGYAAALDDVAKRLLGARTARGADASSVGPWLAAVLVALPVVVITGVSLRHARYQRVMGQVRDIASGLADAYGDGTLGVTENACKAGLLHGGPTRVFDPRSNRTAVVFCSEVSASHRASDGVHSCAFPGYHTVVSREGFDALVRDDAGGDAR
jgi:hypothetical protein